MKIVYKLSFQSRVLKNMING